MAFSRMRGVVKLTLLSCLLHAGSTTAINWKTSVPTEPIPIPELAQDRAPPGLYEPGAGDALMDMLMNSNISDVRIEPGHELIRYWNIANLTVADFFNPWFRSEHGLRDPRVEQWWLFQERLAEYRNHPLEQKVRGKWSMTKVAKEMKAMHATANAPVLNLTSTTQVAAARNGTAASKMANLERRGRISYSEQAYEKIFGKNNRTWEGYRPRFKPEDLPMPPKKNGWSFNPMSKHLYDPHCWTEDAPDERFGNFGGAQLCRDMLMVLNKTIWANEPWVRIQCKATYEGVTTAVSTITEDDAEADFSGKMALGLDWLTASCPRQRNCYDRTCEVGGYIAAHGQELIGVLVSNGENLHGPNGKVRKVKRKKNEKNTFWY